MITIEIIPHAQQAYNTIGNYWTDDNGNRHIVVSDMGDNRFNFLVALHEMIEQELCWQHGISEQSITEFDEKFEALRKAEPEILGEQEPGHMDSAPYHQEHVFAERVEKQMASEIGVDWNKYNQAVNDL